MADVVAVIGQPPRAPPLPLGLVDLDLLQRSPESLEKHDTL
jgi:hypothetical protein